MSQIKRNWQLVIGFFGGAVVHVATALLRLSAFCPTPKMVDFSSFYVAAWSLRLGVSPYTFTDQLVETVSKNAGFLFNPPAFFNPPIFAEMLIPLTYLNYPFATWIWLAVNLLLVVGCTILLCKMVGGCRPVMWIGMFLGALTFGPTFLALTLGQISILLLLLVLLIGRWLGSKNSWHLIGSAFAVGLALILKLWPVMWVASFFCSRQWRLLIFSLCSICLFLSSLWFMHPDLNAHYWLHVLPHTTRTFSYQSGIDDQSLVAWFNRMFFPSTYSVPSLSVDQQTTVIWHGITCFSPSAIRWFAYIILGILALGIVWVLVYSGRREPEAAFYLVVLGTLIAFPHMERYNHTLLLPAMAYLWRLGSWRRPVVAWTYCLAGLSRLNHLWMTILPVPWAPLASGFGTCAVLLLTVGLGLSIFCHSANRIARSG